MKAIKTIENGDVAALYSALIQTEDSYLKAIFILFEKKLIQRLLEEDLEVFDENDLIKCALKIWQTIDYTFSFSKIKLKNELTVFKTETCVRHWIIENVEKLKGGRD